MEPTLATDDQVQELVAKAAPFALVQLSWADGRHQEGADAIEREHQRRMVGMHDDGTIAVLCPVISGTVCGVAVMTQEPDRAREIMADDPCVQAGMMTVEVFPCAGFPGDVVPG